MGGGGGEGWAVEAEGGGSGGDSPHSSKPQFRYYYVLLFETWQAFQLSHNLHNCTIINS